MLIRVFLEITAAVFAVFGVCSLIRLITETWLTPECLTVTVIYDGEREPEELGCLVNRARKKWYISANGRVAVLVMPGKCLTPEVEQALSDAGVKVFYAK